MRWVFYSYWIENDAPDNLMMYWQNINLNYKYSLQIIVNTVKSNIYLTK